MKYVITGSLGHISKPVVEALVNANHDVTVISSRSENTTAIQALGATALIGSVEDRNFITNAFKGADAVYLMIPPKWNAKDWLAEQKVIADNYTAAVEHNHVKNVVVLSSVGAHMGSGAGPVDGLAYLESKINELHNVNAIYLRPSYFYYNLFSMIPLIKNAGIMGTNQPAGNTMVLTHPADIASVVTNKLLALDFTGKQIEYIGSDERTWADINQTLTKAINKENIPWVEFSDEQSFEGMINAGLPETIAKGYTQMGAALRSGEMQADYFKNKPVPGKTKLEDFASEFAAAFKNS